MYWSIEGDNDFVMVAENDPIYEVCCEFWKHVLSNTLALDASVPSMHICIQPNNYVGDVDGHLQLSINSTKIDCEGTQEYFLCGEHFTFLYEENESDDSYNQRAIKWTLEQYSMIKNALLDERNKQLLCELKKKKQFNITAATGYGLFDLQIDSEHFGELPEKDIANLGE